ncbi:aminoglycoside phosphotransferase family protein [Streptomyces sp. TLI_146]|uniref:aminoglycoside phosphotransferase family protein n=1 Tax=Streptomyces sp. TLI_146 TaxID=1938858 RepID=UPI000CBB08EE|nr:aminoglycoside phosphotransferase family protein [Streptomyces sp. TLI_146]PKV89530.1 aminoglycoside phosphotransferase (APT) family kinase protein [Streptomyces sp. TLI_146]
MDSTRIDAGLVRSLLHAQHPDLAGLGLRPVEGGWDNQLWRLGDELAVRMPRTERAPELLRKEHRWLPVLAPGLPLPVPTPLRTGEPSALFPAVWTVAKWVPGEPADRVPVTEGHRAADTLAGFLRALHKDAPAGAPANPARGVPLARFTDDAEKGLQALASRVPAGVRDIWEDAVSAPGWTRPPVWLHGDLHPANVVVSDGTLTGVLDFGELCAGDPAADLAAAWLLLPAGSASRFFEAYADADAATIRRARGWAVLRGLGLIAIGQAWERGLPGGKQSWGPAGRAALERVLVAT